MSSAISTSLFVALCVTLSLAAKLQVDSGNHDVLNAKQVDVTCAPDGKEPDVRELVILQIRGPGGKVLVSLHQGQQIIYNGKLSNRYHAKGELTKGFLTLSIDEPTQADFGSYGCTVTYMKTDGNLKTDKASGQLTATDVTSLMQNQINALFSRMTSLESTVKELKRKETTTSAFRASTSQYLKVSVGKNIVLPTVSLKHGLEGYSTSTGAYTAPVDGLYIFHLTIGLNCKRCVLIVNIMVNAKQNIAGLGVHDQDYYGQSSTSAMVSLKKGDTVSIIPSSVSNGAKVYDRFFSTFAGHLAEAY